jgi:predicted O-linked N-acetylglucosamine transferase (SPINDLY family)
VRAHLAGRKSEAAARYSDVLDRDPANPDAASMLGVLLAEAGKHDQALALIHRAVSSRPDVAAYRLNLGQALRLANRNAEAIDALRAALAIEPDHVEVTLALARALHDEWRLAEARERYERAVQLAPARPDAWRGLITVLATAGDMEACDREIARYLVHYPQDGGMRFRRATLLPPIATSKRDIARWRERFETELRALLERPLRIDDPLTQVATTNFFLSYHGESNAELAALAARVLIKSHPELEWSAPHVTSWRGPQARIRIGFISKFLRDHSIGKTTTGLVQKLSKERFETVALFARPAVRDDWSEAIRRHADRSVVLAGNLADARRQIAELNLDVLFYQDIGMEPFTYFLAFARLAPVQCVSFGHPDTTGIPAMDYFVSSDLFEEPSAAGDYTEQLFLLHDLPTLAYYHRPQLPATLLRRADFGLPEAGRVYLCAQTLFKLDPEFDELLAGILAEDGEGTLVIVAPQATEWLEIFFERLRLLLPDAVDRVQVIAMQPRERFLNLLLLADVVLDTPLFNGMNSSLEALAVGTPVVTLPGRLQRARHTQAMYRSMRLDELVARTPAEYVRTAVAVARDPARREAFRRKILAAHDVLFENRDVVREFERFFETAIARRQGRPAQSAAGRHARAVTVPRADPRRPPKRQ